MGLLKLFFRKKEEKIIETYPEMVDKLIVENNPLVFGNYSIEKAKYLFKKFFDGAEKEIRVITGNFGEIFYHDEQVKESFYNAAERLNKSNGFMKFITLDGLGDDSKIFESDIKKINSNLENDIIFHIPAFAENPSEISHYIVVDKRMYRVEDHHSPINPYVETPLKSRVCFNGERSAEIYSNAFDVSWKSLKQNSQ